MIKRTELAPKQYGKKWTPDKTEKYPESNVDKSYYQPTAIQIKNMLGQRTYNPLASYKNLAYDFKAGEQDDGRPIGPSGYETLAELSQRSQQTEPAAQEELRQAQEALKQTENDKTGEITPET